MRITKITNLFHLKSNTIYFKSSRSKGETPCSHPQLDTQEGRDTRGKVNSANYGPQPVCISYEEGAESRVAGCWSCKQEVKLSTREPGQEVFSTRHNLSFPITPFALLPFTVKTLCLQICRHNGQHFSPWNVGYEQVSVHSPSAIFCI